MASKIYQYSPLAEPTSIRLLCLLPAEDSTSPIHCQIIDYNLSILGETHLYEALSYVWGEPNSQHHVFIDGEKLVVTPNLHAALQHLRNAQLQRVLWVDAICINQGDTLEKSSQIQLMAKIYSKAARVVFATDGKDGDANDPKIISLLRRPWFRRIWEVAAARSITIKCGLAEIDGHAFAVALDSKVLPCIVTLPRLRSLITPLTLLMKEAVSRQRVTGRRWFQAVQRRPIGELVEMYHNREATVRHDKLFALYGMASKSPRPDYSILWRDLLRELVQGILGKALPVKAWNDTEIAVIEGKGAVFGRVDKVNTVAQDGQQEVVIDYKRADYGWSPDWLREEISLPPSVNAVRPDDIVCKLDDATNPMIIRPHADYFSIVMITVSLKRPLPKTEPPDWMSKNFLLVWDWTHAIVDASDPNAKFDVLIARHDLDHGLDYRLNRGFDMASVFLEKPATLARPLAEQQYRYEDPKTQNAKVKTALYKWDVRELKQVRSMLRRLMQKRLLTEGPELYTGLKRDYRSLVRLYKRELEVIQMKSEKGYHENPYACTIEETDAIDEILDGFIKEIKEVILPGAVGKRYTYSSKEFIQRLRIVEELAELILEIKSAGSDVLVHLPDLVASHALGGDMMRVLRPNRQGTPFDEPDKKLLLEAARNQGQGDIILQVLFKGFWDTSYRLSRGDLEDLLIAGINNQMVGDRVIELLLKSIVREARNEKHGESILRQLLSFEMVQDVVDDDVFEAVANMGRQGEGILELFRKLEIEPVEPRRSSWRGLFSRGRH
ncbi:heterokaryon incompatibility protein-domain-containing protein [Triangularia verruculosa]|uniref:Heterokaryon incompatibility protein-domain-containing protein n=1 Tax=Triangularia verruculosa TaxID=2587418 RepID=A0AAN6XHV0_9PEZI|nr:heterokaryon incompatibility protein-domain-containing protein [Triangularia verruculosa]